MKKILIVSDFTINTIIEKSSSIEARNKWKRVINIENSIVIHLTLGSLFILTLLMFLPAIGMGQEKIKGINFEHGLSWDQIRAKAKVENKYIFLDCFTTWCAPCKRMDNEVYINDILGEFVNKNFVSVKVQMDRTDKDDENTKKLYLDADMLAKHYKVNSFPTYLLFTPDGALVEKQEGYKNVSDFTTMIQMSTLPGKKYEDPYLNYDQIIINYRKGIMDYSRMPYLIRTAKELNEQHLSDSMIKDYYSYLQSLKSPELYTKENIDFITSTIKSSKDQLFDLFYPNGKKVNMVMNQHGYAQRVVDKVIARELTDSFLLGAEAQNLPELEWNKLFETVNKKYGLYWAERAVLAAKVNWYEYRIYTKNAHIYRPLYHKFFLKQFNQYGIDGVNISRTSPRTLPYDEYRDMTLNTVAWEIFLASYNREWINSALNWMKDVANRSLVRTEVSFRIAFADTYANLLYKAGRKSEALKWEEIALQSAIIAKDENQIESIRDVISKIQRDEPTWPIKPPIDSAAIVNWHNLGGSPLISNNGMFCSYVIENLPAGNQTLFVQSLDGRWSKSWVGCTSIFFTKDNRCFIFQKNDSIYFQQLGNDTLIYKSGVKSYKYSSTKDGVWLAYQLNDSLRSLVLYNSITKKESRFNSVVSYDMNGQTLLLQTFTDEDNHRNTTLTWLDLTKGDDFPIELYKVNADKYSITGFSFSQEGNQLVFLVEDNNNKEKSIWYYHAAMPKAVLKANEYSKTLEPGLNIFKSIPTFSRDGRYIFFTVEKIPEQRKANPDIISLDLWHFNDPDLQSVQLNKRFDPILYSAVIAVERQDKKMLCLEQEYVSIVAFPVKSDYVVVKKDSSKGRFWMDEYSEKSVVSYWLVSLIDGEKKLLPKNASNFSFSPNGNYLIYYDWRKYSYHSYQLQSGKIVNISESIPRPWLSSQLYYNLDKSTYDPVKYAFGIAGWMHSDSALFVYDYYDIWKLDPTGQIRPINITNGYGRRNHIRLRFSDHLKNIFDPNESYMLTAYNTIDKRNGFYFKRLNKKSDPDRKIMGPWTLWHHASGIILPAVNSMSFGAEYGMMPVKAKDRDIWLLRRSSSSEAPNFFYTSDFKTMKSITLIQPESTYNWVTSELVTYKQQDGIMNQGILHKPENFDSSKTYPVIFYYYEQTSHRMYKYPTPEFTGSDINVAWFVSRGYLVFTPDIYMWRKKGELVQSINNSIVSAVKWLSNLPYVDKNRMGLNGHSDGGFITNNIITHSDLFAAAIEGAGSSNSISTSLQLSGRGRNGFEHGSGGVRLNRDREEKMGGTIWQKPNAWLKNSPILYADKITTPLLIFHSKVDLMVPWEQAVELFVALRRLEKRVWMLQYDGHGHGNSGQAAVDYTKRITQYYDHYLKGAPAPKWMTQGIPARLKGVEDGLELDPMGSCAKDCKVCKMWNEKMKRDSLATLKEIEETKVKEHWQ